MVAETEGGGRISTPERWVPCNWQMINDNKTGMADLRYKVSYGLNVSPELQTHFTSLGRTCLHMDEGVICWNCGKRLDEAENFCAHCGVPKTHGPTGVFTPETRRVIKEAIQTGDPLPKGTAQHEQFRREVRGMLEDCILMSELDSFNLFDVVLPSSIDADMTQETDKPSVGALNEEEAAEIVGFLHLIRLVKESAPTEDLDEMLSMLEQAEEAVQMDHTREPSN